MEKENKPICINCNKELNTYFTINTNELSHFTSMTMKISNQDLINSEKDLHNSKDYDIYLIPILLFYKKDEENAEKYIWITNKKNRISLKIWTSITQNKPVYIKIATEATGFTDKDGKPGTYMKPVLTPYSDIHFTQKIQQYKS